MRRNAFGYSTRVDSVQHVCLAHKLYWKMNGLQFVDHFVWSSPTKSEVALGQGVLIIPRNKT